MPVQSLAKGVRISPRKVAVVAALIRGRSVEDALVILEHTPRNSATAVRKAVESARANADHNHGLKPSTLRIIEIGVTSGPSLKRYRPAAHGRALPFQRRSCHIRVVVDGEAREVKKVPAAKASMPKTVKKEEDK